MEMVVSKKPRQRVKQDCVNVVRAPEAATIALILNS
jgi:hypothetical protein